MRKLSVNCAKKSFRRRRICKSTAKLNMLARIRKKIGRIVGGPIGKKAGPPRYYSLQSVGKQPKT